MIWFRARLACSAPPTIGQAPSNNQTVADLPPIGGAKSVPNSYLSTVLGADEVTPHALQPFRPPAKRPARFDWLLHNLQGAAPHEVAPNSAGVFRKEASAFFRVPHRGCEHLAR
jgi:hypothetical protein